MAKYQIKKGQNLFDVAIHLYGSIEGIYDLLISNPSLFLHSELKAGMELEYHEYFVVNDGIVDEINTKGYLPANGERHVYYKECPLNLLTFMIKVSAEDILHTMSVAGDGEMIIDWGDNSNLEHINLIPQKKEVTHYYDSVVENERWIKIYGTFSMSFWDTSKCDGEIYAIRPVIVDEYVSTSINGTIEAIPLFEGLVSLNLSGKHISDLSPIYDSYLQILDLRDVVFDGINVLDNYLINLVENHGKRRDCTVYLTTQPSEIGMSAINTILEEESWNESGKWCFDICGTIYKAQ